METLTRNTGVIRKGAYQGVIVVEAEYPECPRYEALNGERVTIVELVTGEKGRIFAVRASEVHWL
jgi:hypothetical protein